MIRRGGRSRGATGTGRPRWQGYRERTADCRNNSDHHSNRADPSEGAVPASSTPVGGDSACIPGRTAPPGGGTGAGQCLPQRRRGRHRPWRTAAAVAAAATAGPQCKDKPPQQRTPSLRPSTRPHTPPRRTQQPVSCTPARVVGKAYLGESAHPTATSVTTAKLITSPRNHPHTPSARRPQTDTLQTPDAASSSDGDLRLTPGG